MDNNVEILGVPQLECATAEEVITELADMLVEKNLVKENYATAILEREHVYPTGLPSGAPQVAIPHADNNLVKKTSLAIAALKNTVKFHNMEDTNAELDIQIVIMMAIAEAHGQIEMLQKIIGFIQDEDTKEKVLACATQEELLQIVDPIFNN